MFFSIRHHTQSVETSLKHVDDLKIVSTNLFAQHLEDRVLDRVNNIMRDLKAARKQHVPVAGRMKPKPTERDVDSLGASAKEVPRCPYQRPQTSICRYYA